MTPDQSETEKIERRLKNTVSKLHQLATLVGAAEQVIDFSSDQRKNILAAEQMRFVQRGESVAGAEVMARNSPSYLENVKTQQDQLTEAYRVRAEWKATFAEYDACRSLLAMTRESMRTLEG